MNPFDKAVLSFINQFAHRSEPFDLLIHLLSYNLLLKGGVVLALFWWAWFAHDRPSRQERVRLAILGAFAGAIGAGVLTKTLQLFLPPRLRPLHDPAAAFVAPFTVSTEFLGASSFPSDHAALFAGLAVGLLFVSRPLGAIAIVHTLLMILLPRIYLGFHFPTDIIVGAMVGIAAVASVNLLRHKNLALKRLFDWTLCWSRRTPAAFYTSSFLLSLLVADVFDSIISPAIVIKRLLKALVVS